MSKLQYRDLDLKGLREKCDIDFAHYTYIDNMCSCCYGPRDFPARYWRNGVIKDDKDISFILFKNASNGSGQVKRTDYLSDQRQICIEWSLNDAQLDAVIKELEKQVGSEFNVIKPDDEYRCIILERKTDKMKPRSQT